MWPTVTYHKNLAIWKKNSSKLANLGHFFSWKFLCISRNHIFQVEVGGRLFASKRNTASGGNLQSPVLWSVWGTVRGGLGGRIVGHCISNVHKDLNYLPVIVQIVCEWEDHGNWLYLAFSSFFFPSLKNQYCT